MKRPLLKHLDELEAAFGGKRVSLFLDFDGTLTPIVARPETARLSYQMKELLKSLGARYPLAIISGRGLEDVKERVGIPGVVYAANHGMEIWSKDFTMVYDIGGAKRELAAIEKGLREKLGMFKGVVYENKGATASVHYRLLDVREEREFMAAARAFLKPYEKSGVIKVTEGKKVMEVRPPVSWHKGRAVEWLMERARFASTVPVYAGDDHTDFDAFRAVSGRGVSVFVGSTGRGSGEADYYLKSQDEVKRFLHWLKERGSRGREAACAAGAGQV